MRNLRGSVIIAWIFCIFISAATLFYVAHDLVLGFPSSQPLKLAGNAIFSLIPMFFAIPAALIISHQPRNTIGWLLMIPALVTVVTSGLTAYLSTFQSAPQPTFPILLIVILAQSSWLAYIMPLLMVPMFFPTGRLLSPRWRWTIYLAAGMCLFFLFLAFGSQVLQLDNVSWSLINPLAYLPVRVAQFVAVPWLILLIVLTAASITSAIVRFRNATIVEREQMKWLLYACAIFALGYIPGVLTQGSAIPALDGIFNLVASLAGIMIPVAITTAILRYHLFDIDVIIRLTLVYLILTGLLGLIYLGGVILLQQTFRAFAGQTTDVSIVITTLATAALFTPLRLRIQRIIDRRFFRQKYNAEKALNQFSVAVRTNSDLDVLTAMLIAITQETLQPTQVELLLKHRK